MRQLHQKWQDQEPEELLFQLIFKSLGYSVNAAAFEELARLYPYSNLRKLLRTTPRESKTKVLGRCGLELQGYCLQSLFQENLSYDGICSSGPPSGRIWIQMSG